MVSDDTDAAYGQIQPFIYCAARECTQPLLDDQKPRKAAVTPCCNTFFHRGCMLKALDDRFDTVRQSIQMWSDSDVKSY